MADDEQEFPQPTGLVRIIVPDLERSDAIMVAEYLNYQGLYWSEQEQTPATPEV